MRMRRLLTVTAAVAIAVSGVLTLPVTAGAEADSEALADVDVTRYGGADRYATSLLVAEAFATLAGDSLESVVMVSGESWQDAVVAAPLAGSMDAPLLMTPPGQLRDDATGFLERVGASEVVVVSTDHTSLAVGSAVVSALDDLGISVERVSGANRYATGAAAARRIDPVGTMPTSGRTAFVASGEVFADALVAGPLGAHGRHPVLLTPPDELHVETAAYLRDAQIAHVVLMGGPAALSETVETSLRELGLSVTRLAGETRFDTAVQAADLAAERFADDKDETCSAGGKVGLARADVPFDSFGAGPLLGRLCAPLVLSNPAAIPAATAAYLDEARSSAASLDLRVFGGEAAVSQAGLDAYLRGDTDDDSGEPPDPVHAVLPPGTCGGKITDPPRQVLESRSAETAVWSPDCAKINYFQRDALWRANQDGSRPTRLLREADVDASLGSFAWSPDGSKIVYVQNEKRGVGYVSHIWIANADGSDPVQLTDGMVRDLSPVWSPDGATFAFVSKRQQEVRTSRGGTAFWTAGTSIVTMDRDGDIQTSFDAGAVAGTRLAWSRDGSQVAYVRASALTLSSPDGATRRILLRGADSRGGLSWSPDGRRIAYVRYDHTRPSQRLVMVAETEGFRQELVAEVTGRVSALDWSPDGQLLLYSVRDGNDRRVYVAGASGTSLAWAADCWRRGTNRYATGPPFQSDVPTTGTLRVALLFMDFPDAPATYSTREESEYSLEFPEQYLEDSSYGKLDVEFVPLHRWLRAEETSVQFGGIVIDGSRALGQRASAHSIELANEFFDFSTTPAVLTVFPSSRFGGGTAGGRHEVDGVDVALARVNTFFGGGLGGPGLWSLPAAHELLHLLGLIDLYPYDWRLGIPPPAPPGQVRIGTEWGVMGLTSHFFTVEMDERLKHQRSTVGRGVTTEYASGLAMTEMLGWNRWLLGWVDDDQLHCVTDAEAEVSLAPIAQPEGEAALAVIPLNHHEVIVMESRRRLGYDRYTEFTESNGFEVRFPTLIEEGVLVYTVDLAGGELPIKIVVPEADDQLVGSPVLTKGQSLTLRGYTITVTGDDGDRHTVSIRRGDAG
ncbi:MAG: hypothetical protein F4155_04630 [Acidimicrobiales bacterium]|nr:hypothetical protein [Acidimicrobiales bacterium]MYK70768.1 hypothetical protein [Acidimicrobiales bacterium]